MGFVGENYSKEKHFFLLESLFILDELKRYTYWTQKIFVLFFHFSLDQGSFFAVVNRIWNSEFLSDKIEMAIKTNIMSKRKIWTAHAPPPPLIHRDSRA